MVASSSPSKWAAVGVVLAVVLLPAAVRGDTVPVDTVAVDFDRPATVAATAERGTALPVGESASVPPCARVAVVGDSLTDNAGPWLRSALADTGVVFVVDGEPSRRIPASVAAPRSGVLAAGSIRSTWGDADCWVVALGSNDLTWGARDPVVAATLIDEMLAAVTPGARVWWVNVNYHRDPRTDFDFPHATEVFNAVLDGRAHGDPRLGVIDWYTYSEANRGWFFDPVHVDRAGSIARALHTVAALPLPA